MPKGSLFIVGLFAISLSLPLGLWADEDHATNDEEQKVQETIESVTDEVKDEKKKEEKTEKEKPHEAITSEKNVEDESVHNQVGDVTIYNYGINATFINSNVTVHGGEIRGEIHRGAGEKEIVDEEKPTPSPDEPGKEPREGPPPQEQPEQPSPFDKVIEDATKIEGLFTVYHKVDDKQRQVLWEINPEQLDTEFLISGALATGVGMGRAKPGTFLGNKIIEFNELHNKVHFIEKNLRFTAPEESLTEKAVKKNYSDSIMASLPIAATNPETAGLLIDVTKLLLGDTFQASNSISSSLGGGYSVDGGNSFVEQIKNFPKNLITHLVYAMRGGASGESVALPDNKSLTVEVVLDIRPLKKNPDFKPRIADQRIGYFIEAYMDFGEKDEKFKELMTRHIVKWDIRKASPELELSPPIKPIVFWIENTVPEKHRKAVRDGLLLWNEAFEEIGIKDAIVVKQQPEDADWDAADARYNTVHWNLSHNLSYGAVAQFISNPKTGEMMQGGFLIEGDQVRTLLNIRNYLEPDRVEEFKKKMQPEKHEHEDEQMVRNRCEFSEHLFDQATTGLMTIAARKGIENVSEEFAEEYTYQFLRMLAAHEFGHVLGLRHNFKGSTLHRLEDLHNKALTEEMGLTASVMDYSPINIAPEGEEQGYYFDPKIGIYDKLAIKYGYTDIKPATDTTEQEMLNEIAELQEKREYRYGTDEDLISGSWIGIDPLCNQDDLSNDPLAYSKQQAQMALDTIPKLPNLIEEGENYTPLRIGFNRFLNQYLDSSYYAIKYIGGQYVRRVKKGGEYNPSPLKPVSPAKQREALNFIVETIFADDIYDFDPEFLNKLASERWYHWNADFPGPPSEYSITNVVENYYDMIIYYLFSSSTIKRIRDGENQRPVQAVNFTVPELFETMYEGIWDNVIEAETDKIVDGYYKNEKPLINTYRRMLQRIHLKRMIEIMLEPSYGMPEDARTQAWRTLRSLKKELNEFSKYLENVDDYSRDHIEESLAKIERALEARLSVRVDFW